MHVEFLLELWLLTLVFIPAVAEEIKSRMMKLCAFKKNEKKRKQMRARQKAPKLPTYK
jgi:hypothetical protein